MPLIKWHPLRDLTAWNPETDVSTEFVNMHRELDRMFDRFPGGIFESGRSTPWLPAVDINEQAEQYLVKIELPGVNKEDVKITLQNDVLTVRGDKKQESEKKGDRYHRVERRYGSFQRSFTLPTSVNSGEIEASYDNGILTVSLPKMEEAKPKEIEVKVK